MRSSRAQELLIALHGEDVQREMMEQHLDRAHIARRERELGTPRYWALIEGAIARARKREMI